MIGHLGHRVSALLDGQLPPDEAERAWAHVHACHSCRDAVEREGWIKTRLAGLSPGLGGVSDHLKGSLLCGATSGPLDTDRPRRAALMLLGGSAAGVAVIGVVALGLGAANSPAPTREPPVTNFGGSDGPRQLPARVPGTTLRPATPAPSR